MLIDCQRFTDILRTSPPEGHRSSQMGRRNQLDERWTGVDRMSRNIDPYRIKITKQNVDDNIQPGLGSRNGYGGWMHGSSSRGKTPSQEGEHSNTPSNRNHKTSEQDGWLRNDWLLQLFPKNTPLSTLRRKTKSLVDEYLQIHDLNEAVQCVKDLESPKSIHLFVSTALDHVLERSSKARTATGTLLNHLVKQTIVSAESYMKGVHETLQFSEDMQIDIPNIWQYLGELIGPMVQDGCLPLISLRRICEPLSSMAGILVAEILHDMARTVGHLKVGELWRSSRLQWSDFLKPGDNVDEFLRKHVDHKLPPLGPVSGHNFQLIQGVSQCLPSTGGAGSSSLPFPLWVPF
ncbi:Eukaryotic translation initiation factor 4 gamma 1 [Lamellibrachia satsuma]|nr:Eukaryotic translation initiation factor 4 gamma 1 [Lamellibrachia satsuma]